MELLRAHYDYINDMGKFELHTHLDGVVRPETILELAQQNNIDLVQSLENAKTYLGDEVLRVRDRVQQAKTVEQFHDAIRFKKGMTLADCLAPFNLTLAVMQTEDALERITYEHLQDLASDNVEFADVRFCPYLHTMGGLTNSQVLDAVGRGIHRAFNDNLTVAGLILSGIRNNKEDLNMPLVELAVEYHGRDVVGLDLAGGEEGNPPSDHYNFFKAARDAGIPFTIHAGETLDPRDGLENIRTAVHYGASRIGHAVPLQLDQKLMDEVKERGITLELCPTSNILTGATKAYGDHPIGKFYDAGLRVAICTDDAVLCGNTTLSYEMQQLANTFGFKEADFEQMQRYANEGIFH